MLATWFRLQLKIHIKRVYTWIMVILLFLLMWFVRSLAVPGGVTTTVGLCSLCPDEEGALFLEDICTGVSSENNALYDFMIYTDVEVMQQDVAKGRLLCGFEITAQYAERMKQGDLHQLIRMYRSSSEAGGLTVREYIFKIWLARYGNHILQDHAEEMFGADDEKLDARMDELYQMYLTDVDLMNLEIVRLSSTVSGYDGELENKWGFSLGESFCFLMLFLYLWISQKRVQDRDTERLMDQMVRGQRICMCLLKNMAMFLVPWCAGIVIYAGMFWTQMHSFWILLGHWCVIWIVCCGWISLMDQLIKRENIWYVCLMPQMGALAAGLILWR